MAVTLGVKREFEFTGTDSSGDPSLFPRDICNFVFIDASGFSQNTIDRKSERYLAFPQLVNINNNIIIMYSNSDSHAQGSQQWIAVSTDQGQTWTTQAFELPSGNDTSLINSALVDGQSITLKAWTFVKSAGVTTYVVNSTVIAAGETWALWSQPKLVGSLWMRTGYASGKTAMFSSPDKLSWTYVSTMFDTAGRYYTESDFVIRDDNLFYAVVREDFGANNPVYQSTSTDGITWTSPTLVTGVSGRQPSLLKLSNGEVILGLGKRSDTTGYSAAGYSSFGVKTTGIHVWKANSTTTTWGFPFKVESMYSTDGGQPCVTLLNNGQLGVAYYSRKSVKGLPSIGWATFKDIIL